MGVATPPYFLKHSGPCIIAGSALCLFDDLKKAGDYPVIAVNGAANEVNAFALFSQHPDKFPRWIRRQTKKFGKAEVHAVGKGDYPYVDHWWNIKRAGGSAWSARKAASLMGFDKIILCGCPMETGPYVGNHNMGGFMHKENVVSELRQQIEQDIKWHEGVISMSGWTRDLLC